MSDTERNEYLKKLKDFSKRGVKILIDGREQPACRWEKLFKVCDDGGFYMGDYITGEEARRDGEILKEIRFDRVRLK